MGIELPKELADVAAETGLSWPQADEDKLREQAGAWREAQGKLTALAGEADHSANGAVGALRGPSAEAASRKWAGFVHPDNGHLTTAAAGAGEAADRLEHAADQVGQAKVEMVRQLVDAAKNRDAARSAASAGHPTALLGLDTVLRGTATNLSSLTHGLAGAVGPGRGGPVSALTNAVDPNPGAHTQHGQGGLLSTVTGLPAHVVSTVDSTLGDGTPGGRILGDQSLLGDRGPGGRPSLGESPLSDQPLGESPLSGRPLSDQPLPGDRPFDQPLPGGQPLPPPMQSIVDNNEAGTGPIQVPQVPAHYGGFLQSGGFDDVPTPATGVPQFHGGTVASGFTDAAYSPPPQAPAAPVPIAPPPAPTAQPGYVAPPPYTGAAPAPPPPAAPPPAPGAPPGGAAGFAPRQAPIPPGAAAGFAPRQPAAIPPAVAGYAPRQPASNVPYAPNPYAPQQPQRPPEAPQPQQPHRPAEALPPPGTPRHERESIVALFLVHMFPLGHLPVASDRPARQLPVPPPEVDYAPGLRFPPHDHPRSGLIDASDALDRITAGYSRLPTPPGEPAAALREGHDPLGGLHERDWDRRFLAGMRDERPEYAWPPGELYPEGGHEAGEPELLEEGTLLDRFGPITGRIFAPDGTFFVQRSLPPVVLASGYRRYRVLREVPMWRAVSAPWFGQPGGGARYRAVYSADELVTMGYLEDVTFEEGE